MTNAEGTHASVWLDDPDRRREPSPALTEDREVELVVVGGGITGLTTALLAVREGASVVLLEGRRVGEGTTGYTTGKVTSQHSLHYARLIEWAGVERAREYADANQAGIELVARLADELSIDCSLTRADALVYTRSDQSSELDRIRSEVEAAQRLGLPADLVHESDLPFPIGAGVRFAHQIHLHPRRYVDGLAAAFVDAGGILHEDTRVTRVAEERGHVIVETDGGTIRADRAVEATLLPIGVVGAYFARTRPSMSYGIAVRLNADAPLSMTISTDAPTRSTRPWPDGGPTGLIVVGNGHDVGADVDTTERHADLEQWTRATFDVSEVAYRWSAHDYVTTDHVPYVGRAPLHENVYVATGFGKWGLANGSIAGQMIVDLAAGREPRWMPVFDSKRIDGLRSVPGLALGNAKVAAELVTGEGRRDAPRCSHLGCRLRWNVAEETWDCYCHGSRFASDGSVLMGPAVKPIDVGQGS